MISPAPTRSVDGPVVQAPPLKVASALAATSTVPASVPPPARLLGGARAGDHPEGTQRATGGVRAGDGKGRHTTTTARLFKLPDGGDLIDSPGIREFGLWHMQPEDVERGFLEFRDLLGKCRFRDCHHQGEPGCALLAALDSGEIHPARLASYRHIIASLEEPLQG